MKIISRGKRKIEECSNCQCVFEYERNDIKQNKISHKEDIGIIFPKYRSVTYVDEYVLCPDCAKKITVASYSL